MTANLHCPVKECERTAYLACRTYNVAIRAAQSGNALSILLAAFRRTASSQDRDTMNLIDATLATHSRLTRDIAAAMSPAMMSQKSVRDGSRPGLAIGRTGSIPEAPAYDWPAGLRLSLSLFFFLQAAGPPASLSVVVTIMPILECIFVLNQPKTYYYVCVRVCVRVCAGLHTCMCVHACRCGCEHACVGKARVAWLHD